MNTFFKVTYAISVNSRRFYFPWRNRTLSVWDSKIFRRKFREVLNSGHGRFQLICLSPCYVLPSLDYFPCRTTTYLLARLEALTICKNISDSFIFVLNKLVNWECGVFMFTLAARVNSGEAKLVCRSFLVGFLCWPRTYFVPSISARTYIFHSTFSNWWNLFTVIMNFFYTFSHKRARIELEIEKEKREKIY